MGSSLILPKGYFGQLLTLCKEDGLNPEIDDKRTVNSIKFPQSLKEVTLRDYQERAVNQALKYDSGLVISPTGSGKTLLALEILRRLQQKSLVLVHRSDLAKQWVEVVEQRLGLEAGLIGDGEWKLGNEITIALIQTLSSREDETKALSSEFGAIVADECHHIPCETCFTVLGWLSPRYSFGLSATPGRRDGLEDMIYRGIGPAVATISKSEVEAIGQTVPATVQLVETHFDPGEVGSWTSF